VTALGAGDRDAAGVCAAAPVVRVVTEDDVVVLAELAGRVS
jgi:hypothetical protein